MAGRPTKLNEELLKEAREYLDELGKLGGVYLPTIEGLALRLGIHKDTIFDWESKAELEDSKDIQKQFSDFVKELRMQQAEKLIQYGLTNKYNAMMAKLILSKHGYVEEKKVDNTISGELTNVREKIGAFLDDTDDPEDSETSEQEDVK